MSPLANHELSERKESLWVLPASPAIWASHFLLAYATGALWCGKLGGPEASLSPVQHLVAVYTAVALLLVGYLGFRGFRRHRYGDSPPPPHDLDTPEDRHRFLGFATALLSGLSAVAILYTTIAAAVLEGCF